jgi:hypothetical protein
LWLRDTDRDGQAATRCNVDRYLPQLSSDFRVERWQCGPVGLLIERLVDYACLPLSHLDLRSPVQGNRLLDERHWAIPA